MRRTPFLLTLVAFLVTLSLAGGGFFDGHF